MSDLEPKKGPSFARIAIWVIVATVGAYWLISGLMGAAAGGS
ncbi:MAG: hypothetical protein ACOH19_17010 [Rhodoglobus sp.]